MSRTWEKDYTEEVAEGTTHIFKDAVIKDEKGNPLALADLGTVRIWLYRQGVPGTFINNRNGQDIKNTNGGTIAATGGAFTLKLGPADNVLASQGVAEEWHEALIEYTYNAGADKGRVIWRFKVVNLAVPTS